MSNKDSFDPKELLSAYYEALEELKAKPELAEQTLEKIEKLNEILDELLKNDTSAN